jgi:hypothetical protein
MTELEFENSVLTNGDQYSVNFIEQRPLQSSQQLMLQNLTIQSLTSNASTKGRGLPIAKVALAQQIDW